MDENDVMRKYAEAYGCGTLDITPCWAKGYGGEQEKIWCGQEYAKAAGLGARPLPCVRDERGEIEEQAVKVLLGKAQEEFIELVAEISYIADIGVPANDASINTAHKRYIAEEAADTITAITTLCEALGICTEMRDEAQRRVNNRNMERGRL